MERGHPGAQQPQGSFTEPAGVRELFEGMHRLPGNRLTLPEGTPNLPLMFGLVARKPGPRAAAGLPG